MSEEKVIWLNELDENREYNISPHGYRNISISVDDFDCLIAMAQKVELYERVLYDARCNTKSINDRIAKALDEGKE